jgi:hypothetical protein
MTGKQLKSGMRLSHRWVGIVAAAVLLVTSATGILLQHPSWLGPPVNPPLTVTVDPLDSRRMFRGTHWGVELSEDAGGTWREIPMLAPPTDVVRIIFTPDDPVVVHALGADALVVSRDGGRIWQDIPVGISDPGWRATFLDLAVAPGGALHLLTDEGLLTSRDEGKSWEWTGDRDQSRTRDWRRFVHDLHTGHLAGALGRRIVEFGALALLFITVSGVVLFRRNGRSMRG